MTEFRIGTGLEAEINALQNAGEALDVVSDSVSDADVSTLKAASRFVTEHRTIVKLIDLYQELVAMEVSDLRDMKRTAEELDKTIAGKLH